MPRHPWNPARYPGHPACLVALALMVAGCESAPAAIPPDGYVMSLPSPAGPGSSGQFLHTSPDGTVYLSWMEPLEEGVMASASTRRGAFRMQFARWAGNGWSEPRTVSQGDDIGVNWAAFPSFISLPNGALATHYTGPVPEGMARGGVTLSHDGGETWTAGTGGGGEFLRLFPWEDGMVGGIWLRSLQGEEVPPEMAELSAPYTVRTGIWNAAGELIADEVLDPMVCSCCQNAAAVTDEGPVVLYRGRTHDEVRNIMVARYVEGSWSEPKPLHDDGWVIPGCPVNGPSIVADGNRLFAAWYTAPDDEAQVRVIFSEDGGATFGPAFRVDSGDPLGRVDVSFLPDGTGLVSWLERTAEDAEIRVRRIDATGRSGPALIVHPASEARTSGFPRMVVQGEDLYFAWAEPGEPGELRVAHARAPDLR